MLLCPLIDLLDHYSDVREILFVLKYHIISVIESIDATMKVFENNEATDPG